MSQKGPEKQGTRDVMMQSGGMSAHRDGGGLVDPDYLIGQTIAGRYQVERIIGRGGMGVVYLAQQLAVQRKVVVKVLPRGLREDARARRRFEREARGLSALQHPNVVTLHDFGYEADVPYIVMEYVEGETLSRVMRRRRRLELRDFLPLAAQILSAIGEAHHQGLVHRDLKPDNIMLCERNGRKDFVKILDFGLARLLNDNEEITQRNLLGTALYLSPEQIMGRKLDQRSDVYSLGVLFYLLLCGKKPFAAKEDVNLLFQHVNQEPEPLALQLPRDHDIPRSLIKLIHRCMDKDVARRPFDANEMLRLMRDEISFSGVSVPHFSTDMDNLIRQSQFRIPQLQHGSQDSFVGPDTGNHLHNSSESNPVSPQQDPRASMINMPAVVPVPGVDVPHFTEDEGARLRPTHVFLMLLCVLLVGAGLYLLLMDNKQAGEAQRVHEVMLHAETLISQERFGEAEYLLTSVEKNHDSDPGELLRVANLRERLDVSRLLVEARQREMQKDSQGAIKLYREVLRRNAGHREAQQRLDALLAQPEAKQDGAQPAPPTPSKEAGKVQP